MQLPNPQTVYWDDWVLFMAQIVTLAALVVYVWKTWEMASATRTAAEASASAVKEAIDARLEALSPRVFVYFANDDTHLAEIVLENRGQGTAADLEVHFEPPLKASQGSWDPNRYFETPKPLFKPGSQVKQSLDTWPSYLGATDTPRRYTATVRYRGKENGRVYEDIQILDVAAIEHRMQFGRKDLDDLVRTIEKATGALETGFRKLLEDQQMRAATQVYLQEPTRDAEEYARELVAAWDAGNRIEATVKTRFWWEPLLRSMRTHAFHGYQAAVRQGISELRDLLIAVAALVFVPYYAADQQWEVELAASIEALREWLALPEPPKIGAAPV